MSKKSKKKSEKKIPRKGGSLIANSSNDITIENYSNVLTTNDPTLEAKGQHKGLAIYKQVLSDGRCKTVLNKRKGKVVRREWVVEEHSDKAADVDAADLVREAFQAIPYDRITRSALGVATLNGYAPQEIKWHINDDGFVVPEKIVSHDPSRFVFDKKHKLRLLTREAGMEGIRLPEKKFMVHRFGDDDNNPYGMGLGMNLFWHVLFKREGVAFWMTFLNKFASPTPFGKYPMGTLEKDQNDLLANLLAMVQAGALVAPIGTEVEFLQSGMSGDVSYENWCRYWDEQSSEVVEGGTLSTNIKGGGSRAAAETHSEQSELIADEDADLWSATQNETVIKWITEFNIPGAKPPMVWRPRPKNVSQEEEHKQKKHNRQSAAIKVLSASRKEGYEPKDVGEWLGDVMDTEMVPVTIVTQKPLDTSQSFAEADSHPVAHLIDQLEELASEDDAALIEKLREKLSNAEDYAGASAALLELAAEVQVDPAGNIIGDALALAEMLGRSDIHDMTGITLSGSKKKT